MPHCDTLDGPVVTAAKKALQTGNPNYILIWVPEWVNTGDIENAFTQDTIEKLKAAVENN